MVGQLKIYKDCVSEEPSKVYTCQRVILKTARKIDEYSRLVDKTKDEAKQTQYTLEILKSIFPDFDEADFEYVDVVEYTKFIKLIGVYTQQVLEFAAKN